MGSRGHGSRSGIDCAALRQRADHAFGLGHRVLARTLMTLAILLGCQIEQTPRSANVRRRRDHRGVAGFAPAGAAARAFGEWLLRIMWPS